jgi:hypothetical protein
MAFLYTPEDIQATLLALRIKPINGMVTSQEAAKILTWRAKNEFDIDRIYNAGTIRRHIQLGNLKAEPENKRLNRYPVEAIFDLPIAPRRGYRGAEEDTPRHEENDSRPDLPLAS